MQYLVQILRLYQEKSMDLMEMGFTYIQSGLYSEAIIGFSEALALKTLILDADYFLDFAIEEEIIHQEFIEALLINLTIDSLNTAPHFFLSLCYIWVESLKLYLYFLLQHTIKK